LDYHLGIKLKLTIISYIKLLMIALGMTVLA
jgi:hypothetical protein